MIEMLDETNAPLGDGDGDPAESANPPFYTRSAFKTVGLVLVVAAMLTVLALVFPSRFWRF